MVVLAVVSTPPPLVGWLAPEISIGKTTEGPATLFTWTSRDLHHVPCQKGDLLVAKPIRLLLLEQRLGEVILTRNRCFS